MDLYARKCLYKHKKQLFENVAAFLKKIKKLENFGEYVGMQRTERFTYKKEYKFD